MKVTFNVYPTAFDCPGGGEIQLLKTREALLATGTEVKLFNQWDPQLSWPDVIHHFSVYGGSNVFCNYIKFQKKLPLVISPILWVRGDVSGYPMDEIKYLLDIADLLFPNSEVEADALSDVFQVSRSKFHVTYNGIDPIFTQALQPDASLFEKHFKVNGPFLLNVANIEHRKNQILLAEVAAKLKIPVYNFGNVRDQNYFKQVQAAGAGYFRHLGYINHKDELLRSAYQACIAFILPSLLETPGLAALEAAALGSKLVVTQEGSTKEYFSNLASYVDPHSRSSLIKEIEQVAVSNKSNDLKNHVIKNFSWEKTALECLEGYKKVM